MKVLSIAFKPRIKERMKTKSKYDLSSTFR